MTCITPIHDPSSMCAQKFILYNINLTSPSIHVVCVFPVLFYLICHAEDGTQYDSLCMPALPLRHIAATLHYYSKEEFLVCFWFLVHSFPINMLLNSTKAILYITWFLPPNIGCHQFWPTEWT